MSGNLKSKTNLIIHLDFDGTVVEHAYPGIGREVPHAMRVIKRLQNAGHQISLNTMRVEMDQKELRKALDYLNYHYKVELTPITVSSKEKIYPVWEPSNKEVLFIDDSAQGTPLIPAVYDGINMVDWLRVEQILMENKIL